jgi:hypothetical protein
MTPQEFCYWLQGRAELLPDQPPSEAEWKMIREHLALVFHKVTPARGEPSEIEKALRRFDPLKPPPFAPTPGWDRAQCVTSKTQVSYC